MRKKVAIFLHGGISGGFRSQGFPGIVLLTEKLSTSLDVTVFSLAFSETNRGNGYTIYSPPKWLRVALLRWLWLTSVFLSAHIRARYDCIFSYWGYPMGMLATALGKVINRPSLIYLLGAETANVPEIKYGYLRTPLSRALVLWTCRQVSTLILLNVIQLKALKRYGLNRDVAIVPFGVNRKLFYAAEKPRELPLKMVHVANLTAVKDQHTLIRTFELIRSKIPATLRIVGPDYLNGDIQKFVEEKGLSNEVEFTGPVLHSEIRSHYQWADLCILTSLSEGQNTSLTEAMMCGILPVSTRVGMMDDDFGSTIGIVATRGDYRSLANQIVELYQNSPEWERRRLKAHDWATTYDLEWTAHQLNTLIQHAG
jgi:glycosyltransferase involved in cell wall biosynthesis